MRLAGDDWLTLSVLLATGGFLEFQACHGDLCEDKSRLMRASSLNMTSLSQPCLPITNVGPTRILPFLYLGSQQDAHNHELLAVNYRNHVLADSRRLPTRRAILGLQHHVRGEREHQLPEAGFHSRQSLFALARERFARREAASVFQSGHAVYRYFYFIFYL